MHASRLLVLLLAGLGLAMVARRGSPVVSDESLDPCTEPLSWHVALVDPRFGLSTEEVHEAVREAAALWEEAGGRRFFRADTAGMAIRLVYDTRQEELEQRRPAEARLRNLREEAEAYGRRAESLRRQMEADEAAYRRRPGPETHRRYESSAERYNRGVDRFNRAAAAYNDALDNAPVPMGPREVRAGDLQATSRTVNGRVVSVERTLTVGLVGSRQELARVLTHELGHALGLQHVDDDRAVMAEVYWQEDGGPVRLQPADRTALRRLCGSGA